MTEVICDSSPIQYLHQLGQLDLVRAMSAAVFVPPAVANEIARGIALGINLPDLTSIPWIGVRPLKSRSRARWRKRLGAGESEVMQLALEIPGALALLDDRVARRIAVNLKVPVKGTIGLLIDAKRAGLIVEIRSFLDQLNALGFRLAPATRAAALRIAGEPAP